MSLALCQALTAQRPGMPEECAMIGARTSAARDLRPSSALLPIAGSFGACHLTSLDQSLSYLIRPASCPSDEEKVG